MPRWWVTIAANRVVLYKDKDLHGPLSFPSAFMFPALEMVLDELEMILKWFAYAGGQVG